MEEYPLTKEAEKLAAGQFKSYFPLTGQVPIFASSMKKLEEEHNKLKKQYNNLVEVFEDGR